MRLLFVVVLAGFLSPKICAQTIYDYAEQRARELHALYAIAHDTFPGMEERSDIKTRAEYLYVERFPKDFETFALIFGYDYRPNLSPDYLEHLEFFSERRVAPQDTMTARFLRLGVGGSWDADAISWLQDQVEHVMEAHPEKTVDVLAGFSDEDLASLFRFYFDGPHPPDEIPAKLKPLMEADARVAAAITAAHAKAEHWH